MIVCTSDSKFYNYVIHNFMEIEDLDKENNIKDFLNTYTFPWLVKEQFDKCVKITKELFYWTADKNYHSMSAFHEVILYCLIRYMKMLQQESEDFKDIYFDEISHKMIIDLAQEDKEELPECSLKELEEYYFDVSLYEDGIFSDTDFLDIEIFYNNQTLGDESLIKRLGVNMDYYFEILPKDIRDRYKTGHFTLSGEISALIKFLKEEIENRDLYKLFWNKSMLLELKQIGIILNNIILFYFKNQEIDIVWDITETIDSLKLIFSKKREEEKVLFELIDINKRDLNKEIIDKMFEEARDFSNAFFIFLASNINEKKLILKFISDYIYTDTKTLYLNVHIFDYHKRKAISKK